MCYVLRIIIINKTDTDSVSMKLLECIVGDIQGNGQL